MLDNACLVIVSSSLIYLLQRAMKLPMHIIKYAAIAHRYVCYSYLVIIVNTQICIYIYTYEYTYILFSSKCQKEDIYIRR